MRDHQVSMQAVRLPVHVHKFTNYPRGALFHAREGRPFLHAFAQNMGLGAFCQKLCQKVRDLKKIVLLPKK